MKRAIYVLVALMVLLAASTVYAKTYAGFDATCTQTSPGTGTFTITGENYYCSVDVSGTYEVVVDHETKTYAVAVTFDVGSTVTAADGTVIELCPDGVPTVFTYSGSLGHADGNGGPRVLPNIINYVRSLLEG